MKGRGALGAARRGSLRGHKAALRVSASASGRSGEGRVERRQEGMKEEEQRRMRL